MRAKEQRVCGEREGLFYVRIAEYQQVSPIQPITTRKTFDERGWIGCTSGRALDDRRTWKPLPVPVDMLAKPVTQSPEIASRKCIVQGSHLSLGRQKELGRVDVPECVRGEVSDESLGPMSVLKATGSIVLRRDAKTPLVKLTPRTRKIGCTQVISKKRSLEVEPDHDVQVVRHFIRPHAQDTWRDPIYNPAKGV